MKNIFNFVNKLCVFVKIKNKKKWFCTKKKIIKEKKQNKTIKRNKLCCVYNHYE